MAKIRTFYCVTSRFFNDGTMSASITANVRDYAIPQATRRHTAACDIYNDWFESYLEAKQFVKDTEKLQQEMRAERKAPPGQRGWRG